VGDTTSMMKYEEREVGDTTSMKHEEHDTGDATSMKHEERSKSPNLGGISYISLTPFRTP